MKAEVAGEKDTGVFTKKGVTRLLARWLGWQRKRKIGGATQIKCRRNKKRSSNDSAGAQ